MTCDAKIRPFANINDTEIQCEKTLSHDEMHEGVVRDYAYPGSATVLSWAESDRRTFRGTWSPCPENCILPAAHWGNHAP